MSVYELQAPTEWAAPPSPWSSTSLDEVSSCARRWQLLHSRWGDHDRFPVRRSPAAIEGELVHDALDRLTRACGQRGNPPIGSAEFAAALADADFFDGFARALDEWRERLKKHPRPGPVFRIQANAEELANRAVRMFREQYKPEGRPASKAAERAKAGPVDLRSLLQRKRALSEVKLTHPSLPFVGVLDRVQQTADGVEIVDYKTGKPSDKHRRQLLRYALLWWRVTGDAPARVSAQYLDGVGTWPVTPGTLADVEVEIAGEIERLTVALVTHPAEPAPGVGCRSCPVRARCSDGWSYGDAAASADGRGDAELVVLTPAAEHGFLARTREGREVAVVYEAPVARMFPANGEAQVLRVLDGIWRERRSQIEIKAWTEVFVVQEKQVDKRIPR